MYTYLRQSRDLRRENYLYLCRNRHWLRRTRKSFKNPANSIRHAMHLESFFFIFHFNILIRLNKTRELPIYFLCILFSSFIIFLQNLFCNLRTIYCNFTIVFSEVTKKNWTLNWSIGQLGWWLISELRKREHMCNSGKPHSCPFLKVFVKLTFCAISNSVFRNKFRLRRFERDGENDKIVSCKNKRSNVVCKIFRSRQLALYFDMIYIFLFRD